MLGGGQGCRALKNVHTYATLINSVALILAKGGDKVRILLIGSPFIMTSRRSCGSESKLKLDWHEPCEVEKSDETSGEFPHGSIH